MKEEELEVYLNEFDDLDICKNIKFSIGQVYSDGNAIGIKCKHCGSEEFNVAFDEHYTAIRCKNCRIEICVHSG